MSLSGPDWIKLNRLLDEALDLEPLDHLRDGSVVFDQENMHGKVLSG